MCLVWTIWDPRNIWNYFFPAYLLCITKVDNLYSEGEVIKITKWLWKSNKKREENFWLSSDMLYYAENYNLPLTDCIHIYSWDWYSYEIISRIPILAYFKIYFRNGDTLSIWRELIYAIVKYVSLIFITCMAGKEKTIAKLVGYHHYFHCKL